MYIAVMNAVELYLLGRTLMKLGEDALPEPPGGASAYPGSTRTVLIVAADVATHPASTVTEVVKRTGLPQSQVSTAVARLREAGVVGTDVDPADRRRTVITQQAEVSDRLAEVRAAPILPTLTAALDGDAEVARRVSRQLDELGQLLLPDRGE